MEDLLYFANIQRDIGRPHDALAFVKKFIESNPSPDKNERSQIIAAYKAAIDGTRKTLLIITDQLIHERPYTENPAILDKLEAMKRRAFADLQALCNETIETIDKILIPNADSIESQVFFYKMRGDLYRYMSESSDSDEVHKINDEAEQSYEKAMKLCEDLPVSNPVRLGTILNSAVFFYEHKNETGRAIELVKSALNDPDCNLDELSDGSRENSAAVLKVMRTNLENWDVPEEEEEESPEMNE